MLRFLAAVVGVVIGIPVGGALAFYLTFMLSVLLDPVMPGLGQVGWVFCFFTVPGGAIIGALVCGVCGIAIVRALSSRSDVDRPPAHTS